MKSGEGSRPFSIDDGGEKRNLHGRPVLFKIGIAALETGGVRASIEPITHDVETVLTSNHR